jgi:hypothetical protein
MLLAPSISGLFKWRQFEPEVILLAVGWYLRFSYREVDHITVWRSLPAGIPQLIAVKELGVDRC